MFFLGKTSAVANSFFQIFTYIKRIQKIILFLWEWTYKIKGTLHATKGNASLSYEFTKSFSNIENMAVDS